MQDGGETGADVPDPFGGPIEIYRAARDHMSAAIDAQLPALLAAIDA
ncbi:MAG: hypothetical protein AAGK32_04380 [Actinomycetota bacterium]